MNTGLYRCAVRSVQLIISICFLGGRSADKKCYDQFNSKGSISGNCGIDGHGSYVQCEPRFVFTVPQK